MSSSQSCVETSTDSSNSWEPNQKFHTLTGEVRKLDFPLLFNCWENIPTPVYLCMCAAFTNEISYIQMCTLCYTYINICIYIHVIYVSVYIYYVTIDYFEFIQFHHCPLAHWPLFSHNKGFLQILFPSRPQNQRLENHDLPCRWPAGCKTGKNGWSGGRCGDVM